MDRIGQVADGIIELLGEDISGRRGIKHEWEKIDSDVMDGELKPTWKAIITKEITQLFEPQADEDGLLTDVMGVVDEADCNAEVCFIDSSKNQRLLGWALRLLKTAIKAQRDLTAAAKDEEIEKRDKRIKELHEACLMWEELVDEIKTKCQAKLEAKDKERQAAIDLANEVWGDACHTQLEEVFTEIEGLLIPTGGEVGLPIPNFYVRETAFETLKADILGGE